MFRVLLLKFIEGRVLQWYIWTDPLHSDEEDAGNALHYIQFENKNGIYKTQEGRII